MPNSNSNSDISSSFSQTLVSLTVSALLASYFIINCCADSNNLESVLLRTLAPFSNLQENVSLITEEKESEYKNEFFPYYLPSILLVLRDFVSCEGKTFDQYKEIHQFLNDPCQKSKVSMLIKSCFLDNFKDIDAMGFANKDEEEKWKENIKFLKEKILRKTKIKQINGVQLNCRMICSMIHSFVEEINENCVINITNAFDYLVENECIMGFNEAIKVYNQNISTSFESDEVKSIYSLVNSLKVSSIL